MRNAHFTITIPLLFTSISALSAESKSYIITLCFNVHETSQIIKASFLMSNDTVM